MFGVDPINFTSASGAATIDADSVDLRIEDDKLTIPGIYNIHITVTENGNIRGLTPNPSYLTVI